MIEISATTAIMLYLGMTLFTLLGVWSYYHYRARQKKALPSEQELNICEYCHFAYLEELTKQVTKCQQCGSYNKKKRS
jgi:ribosomal protein L37AE/L43A